MVAKAQRVLLVAATNTTGSNQMKPQGACLPLGHTPVARHLRDATTTPPRIRARNAMEVASMYRSGVWVHISR